MKDRNVKFRIDGILTLVLFGVFALCVLAVLLLGAGSYQRLTERGQESYDRRTAAQYIFTRVHQADACAAVSVGSFAGVDALELTETIEGVEYITRVYCHDGDLRELFSPVGPEFRPEDGERILPAQAAVFRLEDGLITAEITGADGEVTVISVALRSAEVDHEK